MKDALMDSIQADLRERQERIVQLDEKIVEFSQNLATGEVKSHEAFINNEYFLKVSDPLFCRLSAPEQLIYLALWFCERTRSVHENRFYFECRKQIDGVMIDFAVYLQSGTNLYKAALKFEPVLDKRRKIEDLGFTFLSFSSSDIWNRPLEIAEEIFSTLEDQADKSH